MTVSLEQFLKRLTDTGVKSEQDLRACLEKIPLSEWPGDCQQFAKLLVREKFITADQAQKALAEATEATPDLTTQVSRSSTPELSRSSKPGVSRFSKSRPAAKSSGRLLWWMVALALSGLAVWSWFKFNEVELPEGITLREYRQVTQSLHRTLQRTPDRNEIMFNLGVEYTSRRKWGTAAAAFASVSAQQPELGRQARYLQAQSVLQLDRLRDSEQLFQEYLADIPVAGEPPWPAPAENDERIQALHYLSYLLSVELRFDERRELLRKLVQQGDADLFDTLACHFQSLMEWNNTHGVDRLEKACAITPHDWQLQAALAQYRIAQGRPDDAWKLLQECRKQMPDDLLIAAACLTCLEERADLDGYTAMAMRLPPMSDVDPVSLLRHRGQVALRNDQTLEAVTSFQRALALDPAHVPSRMGLAQAWLILKQPERRKQELNATQDLARIQNRLGLAASKTPTPEVMLEIVQLSTDAGLQTAAADVCRISLRLFKEPARFEKLLHKLTKDSSAGRAP